MKVASELEGLNLLAGNHEEILAPNATYLEESLCVLLYIDLPAGKVFHKGFDDLAGGKIKDESECNGDR